MTTTRFTKEQLIAKLQHRLTVAAKYPDVEEAELDAAIFQIALASLTAEPALYAAEETLAYAKMGELHLTCLSEPMGDAVIPLYTSPPAPVSVPEWTNEQCLEFLSIAFRHAEIKGDLELDDIRLGVKMVNGSRAAMLHGKAAGNSPVVPDGYVVVPKRLTAENGAKSLLVGEFSETEFIKCPECFGDDECETCDGSGSIEITVPVSWTTIKEIWAKGVEHFAAAPQQEAE